MNLNTLKEEIKEYFKEKNQELSNKNLNFCVYLFLKNSNYNGLYKDIEIYNNKGNYVIGESNFNIQILENSKKEHRAYDSKLLITDLEINSLKTFNSLLDFKSNNELKEYCLKIDKIIKNNNNDSSISFSQFLEKTTFNETQEKLISYFNTINYFDNDIESDSYEANEYKTYINSAFLELVKTKIDRNKRMYFSQLYDLHFQNKIFNKNSEINKEIYGLLNVYLFLNETELNKNVNFNELNSWLKDDDFLKVLINSNTEEEFIEKMYPHILLQIKSESKFLFDLFIKKSNSIEDLTNEFTPFLENLNIKYPYLFDKNLKINETINFNKSYVEIEFELDKFGISSLLSNYRVFKNSIVEKENITINYENDLYPVMQIVANISEINGHKIAKIDNIIYNENEKEVKECFNKFIAFCSNNNLAINLNYKFKMSEGKFLKKCFMEEVNKDVIFLDDHNSNDIVKLFKETDYSYSKLNKFINSEKINEPVEILKLIEKNNIKTLKNK